MEILGFAVRLGSALMATLSVASALDPTHTRRHAFPKKAQQSKRRNVAPFILFSSHVSILVRSGICSLDRQQRRCMQAHGTQLFGLLKNQTAMLLF